MAATKLANGSVWVARIYADIEGDPQVTASLTQINAMPPSAEKWEALAVVHTYIARQCWQQAGRISDLQRRVFDGSQKQSVCPTCGKVYNLNLDGSIRGHGRPARCPGSYSLPTGPTTITEGNPS